MKMRLTACVLTFVMVLTLIPVDISLAKQENSHGTKESTLENTDTSHIFTDGEAKVSGSDSLQREKAAKKRIQKILKKNSNLKKADDRIEPPADDEVVTLIVEIKGDVLAVNKTETKKQKQLEKKHKKVAQKIEQIADGSEKEPEVLYNYYYAFNGMAISVEYKYIDAIKELQQVKNAYVETLD